MRIVLDTNVFVSGILFLGSPNRIIRAWEEGQVELVVSPSILDEYMRVSEDLARRKSVDITQFLQMLAVRSTIWNAPIFKRQVCTDPDDDKFLECAIFSKTKIVVTGDNALLDTSGFRGVKVVTPAAFVNNYLRP